MLRSGISFPFPTFYHHFARLKDLPKDLPFDFPTLHHHWSYSPRSSFQFSTVLPPLMLRPKIFPALWKTWVAYGLPHGFVRHDKILPIQSPNLKNNAFPAKPFFFKMPTLPCIFTSTQPLAATYSHSSGRKWPQVAAFGQINFHPQRSQSTPLNLTIDHGIEFSKWGQYGSTINTGWTHTICLRANDFDTQIMEGLSWCNSSSVGSTHGIKWNRLEFEEEMWWSGTLLGDSGR